MLSILIPVYDYDVRNLVKILHRQATAEEISFEIILADDASPNTVLRKRNQSCRSIENCQIFEFDQNRGRTATRHFLAQKANGDWLLFLDADVKPLTNRFIRRINAELKNTDVIFGGIAYARKTPGPQKILRWKYGKIRESKSVEMRKENPYYSLVSGAFCIQRKLFLSLNLHLKKNYGLNIFFINQRKRKNAKVKHIDIPEVHYELESNAVFLKKTEQSLKTLIDLEQSGKISNNYRPVQKAYLKLKKIYLLP